MRGVGASLIAIAMPYACVIDRLRRTRPASGRPIGLPVRYRAALSTDFHKAGAMLIVSTMLPPIQSTGHAASLASWMAYPRTPIGRTVTAPLRTERSGAGRPAASWEEEAGRQLSLVNFRLSKSCRKKYFCRKIFVQKCKI